MSPTTIQREGEGSLAISPASAPLQIAVQAPTEEEARVLFLAAEEKWNALLRKADRRSDGVSQPAG